jgi:ABC-type Fe3+ transport system substrate-binding protein
MRTALLEPFERTYGIRVDYSAFAGSELPPRVAAERAAGKYLWDVYIGGPGASLLSFVPQGFLERLDSALILPEVTDERQWRNGAPEYLDRGRQVFVMLSSYRNNLAYNSNLVHPSELSSYRNLLDPKWNGKIVVDDPFKTGPGIATFTFFYLHPELGPEFLRGLGSQNLLVLRDYQQEVDAIGRGRHLILLGGSDNTIAQRIDQGTPIANLEAQQVQERSDVSSGSGNLSLFSHAPHPNAARVYVNWLLSKEGQELFAKASNGVSTRLDVPPNPKDLPRVPQPGAINTAGEQAFAVRDDLTTFLKTVLGPG